MNNAELIATLRGENYFVTLLHDAADALEAAEKRIEELERNFSDVCNANGSLACERNKLLNDVRELEAQQPKKGGWIEVHDWLQIPQEERGTYRCSACGQVMKYPWNYCPNCGARMRGEHDDKA